MTGFMAECSKVSISCLMIWVAVLTIDLAILRAAITQGGSVVIRGGSVREHVLRVALLGLSLQVGVARAIHGGRDARVFWAGYAVGGIATAAIWLTVPRSSPVNRPLAIYDFWVGYIEGISAILDALPGLDRFIRSDSIFFWSFYAIVTFLPPCLLGTVAGLFAKFICRRYVDPGLQAPSGDPPDPNGQGAALSHSASSDV